MKKIESIEIQGRLFPIDPAAYKELEKYLQSIRKHFSRYDSAEILTDIESRIAEKFATEVLTTSHKTITLADVKLIIGQMGDVKDMEDNSEEAGEETQQSSTTQEPEAPTSAPIKKRLFRNTDEAVLGGVAAGIAAYFNIDPLFVRLFFLLTFWIGGYNVLLYIILWVLTPEAKTPTEKLQMRGDSVTLSSLEKTLKDEMSRIPSRAEKVRDSVAASVSPAGGTIKAIAKFFVRLAGLGIILGAITALVVSFFGLIIIFSNLALPFVDPAVYEIMQVIEGPWLPTLFASLYMAIALPKIFSLLVGVSLLRLRSVLKLWIVLPMFILWLFSLGTLFTFGMKFAPAIEAKAQEIISRRESKLKSELTEKNLELADFSQLEVKSSARVVMHTGEFQVKAFGRAADIERMNIAVDESRLVVGESRDGESFDINDRCWIGCERHEVVVHVWAPEFSQIEVSDIARVESDGLITSSVPVSIHLRDVARLSLELNAPQLLLQQAGVSRSEVSGSFAQAVIELNDNSRSDLKNAEINTIKATTHGVSRLSLPEIKEADLELHDSSAIDYEGEPEVLKEELHGVSRINGRQSDRDELDRPSRDE